MNTNNTDTTGLRGIPRAKALIACAEAQDAGKKIQLRGEFYEKWNDVNHRLCFEGLTTNYRVKPEPVVTTAMQYVLYVPRLGSDRLRHHANYVGTYETRTEAWKAAESWCGECLIDEIEVTYADGVETSRTKGCRL